jgi:hypothetical protein
VLEYRQTIPLLKENPGAPIAVIPSFLSKELSDEPEIQ